MIHEDFISLYMMSFIAMYVVVLEPAPSVSVTDPWRVHTDLQMVCSAVHARDRPNIAFYSYALHDPLFSKLFRNNNLMSTVNQ